MSETIIVAIIAGVASLIGSIVSMIVSAANTKTQNGLTLYRIKQLEEKVMKHNNLVERMYAIEKKVDLLDEQIKNTNQRLDDVEDDGR